MPKFKIKFKILTISFFFFFGFFGLANSASAVTEFKATVKPSGGDYSTLATAENGLDYTGAPCDLTSTNYLTAGYDGAMGDPTLITDAEAVTWDAGASTGNIIHITTTSKSGADKFFINVTAGALADDDVIDDGDGNTITVNGTPDTAQISIEIDGDWTGVTDTTAVVIDGWTTDTTHYIKIYTTAAARHDGKWNTGKYRLSGYSDGGGILNINEAYVRIDGLQIQNTKTTGAGGGGLFITNSGTEEIYISNSIIKDADNSTVAHYGIYLGGASSNFLKIWNVIIYDFNITGSYGMYALTGGITAWIYNVTIFNCANGFYGGGSALTTVKNSITQDCIDGFVGTFHTNSDYNLSDLAADAPGANSRNSTNVTFVNAANKDFHLAPTDAGAKNYGANLYADGSLPITTDIDNQARPDSATLFDIGADEAANNVFYSVGQDGTTDRKVASNVTISSGVATFVSAQTGNIGVGDRVTYETGVEHICYIASKTSTSVWNLVTAAGAACPDHASTDVVSIKREFTSLSSAISLSVNASHINNTDLTAANVVLNLPCYYDSAADTTAVAVTGYTTGANNYIKIYTPNNTSTEANTSQRHDGKWNTGKYKLDNNSTTGRTLNVGVGYTKIDGLQIFHRPTAGYDQNGIETNGGTISNNIVRVAATGGTDVSGIRAEMNDGSAKVYNNLVYYDGTPYKGMTIDCGGNVLRCYVYNNTVYNASTGYKGPQWKDALLKNNIAQNCTDGYNGSFYDTSDYNISDIASDAPSPSYRSGLATTVAFQDSANKDFHLASTDTSARNAGANLYADANIAVTTDIDGQARPDSATLFDIGADEAANNVYYSVGQNATNHSSGGNVYITSGVATFDTAQVATNLGVGDRLTAGGNIYYLASKTDTTHWNVVTKLGAVPDDLGSTAVTSIAHEFTSLSSAISLSVNSSHINNTDLTAANVVLNLPCYYDSAADTVAVTVDGYTTGANNYIKIYTPNNTSTEANTSQRHSGKWNAGKYRLACGENHVILNYEENVRIDGLQLVDTNNGYWRFASIATGTIDIRISNNIMKLTGSGGTNAGNLLATDSSGGTLKAWNNILYYSPGGYGIDVRNSAFTAYVYNNTIYNSAYGIATTGTVIIAKNNISYNNTDNYTGTFDAASTNNLSGPSQTDAPGSNPRNAATVTFVDAANADFHLASNDAGARNYGINLAGDSYLPFSADIDGQQRVDGTPPVGGWDIGADEAAEAVIRFMRNINFGRNINIKR